LAGSGEGGLSKNGSETIDARQQRWYHTPHGRISFPVGLSNYQVRSSLLLFHLQTTRQYLIKSSDKSAKVQIGVVNVIAHGIA
jgi:hypothetical protein